MNTLIVYYSLEGNTRWMVNEIASRLGARTIELIPKKAYPDKGFKKFLWGGKSATMKETPELEKYDADVAGAELVIFATPVWAGTFAPPLRTFIAENDLGGKKLAFAACSSSGNAAGCFAKLKSLLGDPLPLAELSLKDPKTKPMDESRRLIDDFCRKLLQEY